MTPQELFIKTLDELAFQINSSDEYEVLMCSGLIRKLMIDGNNSLMHQANRSHRCEIQFEIADVQMLPEQLRQGLLLWCAIDELSPNFIKGRATVKLKESNFLSKIIGIAKGHEYSILDIIKFTANVMGGIHSGSPKDEKDKALSELKEWYFFGATTPIRHIRAIAKIILVALAPLRDAVLNVREFDNAAGMSFYMAIAFFQIRDSNNFIFDIGFEERRNRIFAYIDSGDQLWFKLYDSKGAFYSIRGGNAGVTFPYETLIYLSFKVSALPTKLLLSIDFGEWNFTKIIQAQADVPKDFHLVLASNFNGTEQSNIALVDSLVYSVILPTKEHRETYEYVLKVIERNTQVVRFNGKQPMMTKNHPNFSK